jgi:hypothetical protein
LLLKGDGAPTGGVLIDPRIARHPLFDSADAGVAVAVVATLESSLSNNGALAMRPPFGTLDRPAPSPSTASLCLCL